MSPITTEPRAAENRKPAGSPEPGAKSSPAASCPDTKNGRFKRPETPKRVPVPSSRRFQANSPLKSKTRARLETEVRKLTAPKLEPKPIKKRSATVSDLRSVSKTSRPCRPNCAPPKLPANEDFLSFVGKLWTRITLYRSCMLFTTNAWRNARDERDALQTEVENEMKENEQLKMTIYVMRQLSDADKNRFQAQLMMSNESVCRARKETDGLKTQLEVVKTALEHQKKASTKIIQDLEVGLHDSKIIVDKVLRTVKIKETENEDLTLKLKESQNEDTKLRRELDEARKTIDQLQIDYSVLYSNLNTALQAKIQEIEEFYKMQEKSWSHITGKFVRNSLQGLYYVATLTLPALPKNVLGNE